MAKFFIKFKHFFVKSQNGVLSDEIIGSIPFSIEELNKEGKNAVENWYDIDPVETRRNLGSVHIRCHYNAEKPALEVTIIQAFKIGKISEVYAKVKIGLKKFKTKLQKSSSPIWNETFEFPVYVLKKKKKNTSK